MSVKAIYADGVLKPKSPLHLKEHEEVELEIKTAARAADVDDPTGWKTARELIGCITEELTATDVSVNPDRHVYRRDR